MSRIVKRLRRWWRNTPKRFIDLPNSGTLYVVPSLHGDINFFERWLSETSVLERINNGEKVFGLVMGDVVDLKSNGAKEHDDSFLVDELKQINLYLGERKDQFVTLMGNHELKCLEIFNYLRGKGLTKWNREEIFNVMYKLWPQARQFDFVRDMTINHYDFLMQLPFVVRGNSFLFTHGGPATSIQSLDDVLDEDEKVTKELLWSRPACVKDSKSFLKYNTYDVDTFLKKLGSNILVNSHTPIIDMPEEFRNSCMVFYGNHNILLPANHIIVPNRCYLAIDLSKHYSNIDCLTDAEVRLI